MAFSKAVAASMLISLLVLQLIQAQSQQQPETNSNQVSGGSNTVTTPTVGKGNTTKLDCGTACGIRCSETKRPNLCQRACGSCCAVCKCVPPGTSGNYQACPCYASLTTHGNRRKCP